MSNDMRDLLDTISKAEGFVVTPHGGTRARIQAPNGQMTFVSTHRPGGRAVNNCLAWAKRNGFEPVKVAVRTPVSVQPFQVEEPVVTESSSPVAVPDSPASAPEPSATKPVPAPVARKSPVVRPAVADASAGSVVVNLPPMHPALPLPGAMLLPKGNGVFQEDRVVDPDLAAAFLEYNQDNRVPQRRLVDSWSRTMLEGGWVEEIGDPIRFANTGKLLDGQKRLMAVVKSGVAVRFSVYTGLSESSQDVMDSGQKRSVSDQLKINGYRNFMIVAAAARLLWLWDHGALISGDPAPSNVEQLEYVLTLDGEGYSIEESSSIAAGSGASRIIAPSVIAATHFKMSVADPGRADEFWHMLGSGAGMPELSPTLALRETMQRRKDLRQKLTQAEQVFFVARAWTLWGRGAKVSKLQFPKERMTMAHIPAIV